uniref:UL3.5 n=1 Tax=Suid herpesvirus 1 TaxID=10345 RepID=Q69401_SUHV|nr:UL3.5 [Suid alphaherpesvirus 1]
MSTFGRASVATVDDYHRFLQANETAARRLAAASRRVSTGGGETRAPRSSRGPHDDEAPLRAGGLGTARGRSRQRGATEPDPVYATVVQPTHHHHQQHHHRSQHPQQQQQQQRAPRRRGSVHASATAADGPESCAAAPPRRRGSVHASATAAPAVQLPRPRQRSINASTTAAPTPQLPRPRQRSVNASARAAVPSTATLPRPRTPSRGRRAPPASCCYRDQ